jgi:DNA-directed RNA polymerase specialized sigma24 family protein
MKAGIVRKPDEWKWSSCLGYYGMAHNRMLNDRVVLQLFSNELENARARFKEYNERVNGDQCLEDEDKKRKLSDDEARKVIKKVLREVEIPHVKSLPQAERIPLLRKVKKIEGVSQRQAARILGISPSLLFKA